MPRGERPPRGWGPVPLCTLLGTWGFLPWWPSVYGCKLLSQFVQISSVSVTPFHLPRNFPNFLLSCLSTFGYDLPKTLYSNLCSKRPFLPWLMWLTWLGIFPQTKMILVQFQPGHMLRLQVWSPVRACTRGNRLIFLSCIDVSLSLSSSLPLSLSPPLSQVRIK